MSWTYEIVSGRMYNAEMEVVGVGYSGAGEYKNNASAQSVKDEGPIPEGNYVINQPVDTVTHGPYVLWLIPDPRNLMWGRSGFGIHGDSVVNPGTASEGCVIQSKDVRQRIWESGDHDLEVVAGPLTTSGSGAGG